MLNYLATRPKLATFVTQALIQLYARITKLGWFDCQKDDYVFRNAITDVTRFLQVYIYIHIRIFDVIGMGEAARTDFLIDTLKITQNRNIWDSLFCVFFTLTMSWLCMFMCQHKQTLLHSF